MARVTSQQIVPEGYMAFERGTLLPADVRRAARALLVCRTAGLGGHGQRCPNGHVERGWYNSCRHRRCPPCPWLQVEPWLIPPNARLRACEHDHVISTLPDALRGFWRSNRTPLTVLLCATVRAPLCACLADATYLGARPTVMAARHTWSQTGVFQPHRHGLVTGGGRTDEGPWGAVQPGLLLPVRVVMAGVRGKRRAALRQGVAQRQRMLPAGRSRPQRAPLLHTLGRMTWKVPSRERYAHGVGVLPYLARYLRAGPLANQRVVACETGPGTCRYRLTGEASAQQSWGLMSVPIAGFLRRYLPPVPAPGTRVVRSAGRDAPSQREALAVCRAQLGQGPVGIPAVLDWQAACSQRGADHPERCPRGGRLLVCSGVMPRSSGPAAVAVRGECVA